MNPSKSPAALAAAEAMSARVQAVAARAARPGYSREVKVTHVDPTLLRPKVVMCGDCGQAIVRMFALHEIAGAMVMAEHTDGSDYIVTGNKRERMAQYGNAVTPPAARELITRILEVLG